jgi:hypothetical protein
MGITSPEIFSSVEYSLCDNKQRLTDAKREIEVEAEKDDD